ncbi:MAG TPA: hypothetical protein VHL09_12330 [Dehalococcoidia bacterium]|nr:hypothetical protein [Dehalococcoidia bacterium]
MCEAGHGVALAGAAGREPDLPPAVYLGMWVSIMAAMSIRSGRG